jgi:hypothetical protein
MVARGDERFLDVSEMNGKQCIGLQRQIYRCSVQ